MTIAGFEVASAVRAADGFAAGGDAIVARESSGRLVLCIIDVLGHGPAAHKLATEAEALLARPSGDDVTLLIRTLDEALKGSLGAAVAVATLQPGGGSGQYVGIGNTVARIFGRSERRLTSVDGIVGQAHASPRIAEFTLGAGDVLVLHTDGISSRFAAADYPQLASDDVEISARELIKRFGKTYDDAACIVARRTT
jgi:serine phosphatase RsbU (regulator of sigma subunit)